MNADRALADLRNWGRAMSDNWLEHHGGIDAGPAWKQYVSGKSFDEPEAIDPPVDEIQAARTEAIVVKIGTIEPDYYEVLVALYPNRRSYYRIAKDIRKSVPQVKRLHIAAEQMFRTMRKR